MSLVPAICTQCGAHIEVDNTLEAAICKFCGTAFIVEKAVNNYNINSYGSLNINNAIINNGPTAINYVKRAEQFKKENDLHKAIEYYNKALDLDADCFEAFQGLINIKEEMVLNNVTELLNKQEIGKAIKLLQNEKNKGLNTPKIIKEIENIENSLNNTILFSSEAYYKFRITQLVATKGNVFLTGKKFCFESKDGNFDVNIKDILCFSTAENMNYKCETIGRSVHNCIVIEYKNDTTPKTQKTYIRIHKAKEVSYTLNNLLQKLHI